MVDISLCPICQSTEWRQVFQVTDHSISKEKSNLKECANCSLTVTSPRPSDENLSYYYQSENYISHSGKANNLIDKIYLLARNYSLKWKLNLVNQISSRVKALDIGCGTGDFLNTLKNNGWEIEGVEPSEDARQKAEQLTSSTIHNSLVDAKGQYGLITLWHVLEHLPHLNQQIKNISEILSENGLLLIAVPNHKSWDGQKYRQHWAGYDVPRHLWHFNQKSMVLLLQKHGLKLSKTIPMKLDAFYVSMLSEKYKGGPTLMNPIKGFISGIISNQKAKSTGEYSSLIFIAHK